MRGQRILELAMAGILVVTGLAMHRDGASAAASGSLLYTLDTPNPQPGANFGRAVTTGDVNGDGKVDSIVGAESESVAGNMEQGRAYAFSGADGSALYTLNTPNPQPSARFGGSVAAGDVNGDGKADIVVGAWDERVGVNAGQGRTYVFSGADGALLYTLGTPNPQADGYFGFSVAAGDLNGDGRADIVVGAYYETVGGNAHQGRAYVFSGADGTLLHALDTPNPQAGAYFGLAVAAGDMNGDGKADIVVGAPDENSSEGHVYVFSGADGSLARTVSTPNPQPDALFGASVTAGDVNGDGRSDTIVGAPTETVSGNARQGRAYVFSGTDGSLLRTLTTPIARANAWFGLPVAAGDVDGDGKADVIAGAPQLLIGGNGRVYAFSGTDGSLILALTTPNASGGLFPYFGYAVATGDVDNDGKADFVAGAYGESVGGNAQQGQTYVFAGGAAADTDGDRCSDPWESLLAPPTNPNDPWDFFSVPVPALFAAPNPLIVFADNAVGAGDAQAVFGYFQKGARAGSTEYEQDLNGNGVRDGLEYDRSVVGPGQSGPPDGMVTATDAQLAFAQFKLGYTC